MLSPLTLPLCLTMLLLTTGDPPDNPWKAKAEKAIARAEKSERAADYAAALDATWRADNWRAGFALAERALGRHADAADLQPLIARALWRAGRIAQAEQLAARFADKPPGAVALRVLIEQALARGERTRAVRYADLLEQLPPASAEDWYYIYGVRVTVGRLAGSVELLRKCLKLLEAERNGYPETYIAEAIEGVPEFMAAIGDAPLNQVVQGGAVALPPLVLLNLPSCDVLINGRGPYRMVVDTGGSIMVALDQQVADELGIKSLAQATVRGVSGKQATGQALLEDLQLGSIRCRRVVTRVFDVRGAIMNAADGIIGTGIFADARMTLDIAGGQMLVEPSTDAAGPGTALSIRLISDAKIMVPVTVEGQPVVSLLDTGADAVALSTSKLEELFPDRPARKFDVGGALGIGAGQAPEIALGTGVTLVFGDRTFPNYSGLGLDVLDTTLSPVLGMQTDLLLGMPLFREMKTFTVDFPRAKAWVEWLHPAP